ncbi:thump domain containing protein [Zalerion maritima]|uniref:Thump domain containing protein n=1 Tax=Zalerion maritima TaxID=339359 RepID=A0AAD5RJN2_9PEZI|nr:thump domain containing protein [Zalerion maritima]
MGESKKRKQGGHGQGQNSKRRKHASQHNDGDESRPKNHNRIQALRLERGFVEDGDVGIWVTCARGQEGKAAREVTTLFDDYVQRLYGIKPPGDENEDEEENGDIAASIEKELSSIKTEKKSPTRPFTIIRVNLDCVLFARTSEPIEPVTFCREICRSIQKTSGDNRRWMSRYLNRLTPVIHTARATPEGVVEVGRKVLPQWFMMMNPPPEEDASITKAAEETGSSSDYSFAIRPSFRNHNTLKRIDLIQQIASLINGQKHKVDLSSPDKVILVDVYEAFICMSVVDGDWEQLRRYNLGELFRESKKEMQNSTDEIVAEVKEAKGDEGGMKVTQDTAVVEAESSAKDRPVPKS